MQQFGFIELSFKMSVNILFNTRIKTFLILITFSLLSACADSESIAQNSQTSANKKAYNYTLPEYNDDGWQVGHLNDFGFDDSKISQLVENIQQGVFPGITSLVIARNSKLLLHQEFERSLSKYDHWADNQKQELHPIHSISKSLLSALVGVAIQEGYIETTDTPFYSLFNYSHYKNWNQTKEEMTLKDALTMTLGLEWDEWSSTYNHEDNSMHQLTHNNSDYVKALLDLPMSHEPGKTFAYNTIASIALGAALETKTNIPLQEFAQYYLFSPLNINDIKWLLTPTKRANTGSGLFLKSRDIAKFGEIYLNQGVWNGLQIIDPDWIEQSLKKHVELNLKYTNGYGFQWWLGEFSVKNNLSFDDNHLIENSDLSKNRNITTYTARGYGGQFIIIIPEYELVVSFTANNYDNNLYDLPLHLTEKYILPAIIY